MPLKIALPSEVPGLTAGGSPDILEECAPAHRTLDGAARKPASRTEGSPIATALMRRLVRRSSALGTLGHVLSRLLDRGVPPMRRARRPP